MIARSARSIERALLRKGFRFVESHHRYLIFFSEGLQQEIRTKISRGTNDYGDELLAQVSKQLFLNKKELLELIDCRMSGDDYATLMRERGVIE
jgi:hypothetical protein